MNAVHVRTQGLKCHECTSLVERSVANLDGVIGVTSVHELELTSVMYDEHRVSRDAILRCIRDAGFDADIVDAPPQEQQ